MVFLKRLCILILQDLSALNRDLSKVIMIDCDEKAASDNIRNAIILKKWEGDPQDKTLFDLVPFLQSKQLFLASRVGLVLGSVDRAKAMALVKFIETVSHFSQPFYVVGLSSYHFPIVRGLSLLQ